MEEKKTCSSRYFPYPPLPAPPVRSHPFKAFRAGTLAVFLVLQCAVLQAYRPFFTPDARVAGRGEWLAGIGIDEMVRGGIEQEFRGPDLKIDYGFAKDWEATAAGAVRPYEDRNVDMGVEYVACGIKRIVREGVFQGRPGPSVAAEINGLFLPGARAEEKTGFAFLSSLSTQQGRTRFHAGLGIEYRRAARAPGIVWGGVGEYFVTGRVSLVGEIAGGFEREPRPGTIFLAGIISRTPIGTFDLGVWKRSSDASDDISFTVGTTIPLE